MKKILILEDNDVAVEALKSIIDGIDRSAKTVVFKKVPDTITSIIKENFDLFIVDIVLDRKNPNDASGLNFIGLLREIKKYDFTPIIIVTSIADSKLYAYDMLNCFRYIEKPYDREQVKTAIEKALQMPQKRMENRCVYLRDKSIIQAFKADEIVYIYYSNRKLTIRNINGVSFFYYKSIKELKRQLEDSFFSQCNRNTLVNRRYILKLDMQKNQIVLKNNYGKLTVGRIYKRQLIGEFTND